MLRFDWLHRDIGALPGYHNRGAERPSHDRKHFRGRYMIFAYQEQDLFSDTSI